MAEHAQAHGRAHTPNHTRRGIPLLHRFDGRERTVHWLFALFFLLLLLSGLGLWLPPGNNPVIDHRDLVRTVHLDAALGLLATVIPAMSRGAPLSNLWHQVQWFNRDDWLWLRGAAIPKRLRRTPLPPQGRFNAGQKLNTIAIAAATVGFVVTGTLMWQGAHLPTSLSEAADTWHLWLMVLVIPLIAGHLALSLLLPSTRPAMRGILFGSVRADFAKRRHARWAATVTDVTETPPESPSEAGTA
jgi:formate dehydrogenase subunit gamma